MDAVWEQWDLVCTDPEGCDALVRVLRIIIWSYLGIALLVFYVAIRSWTHDLPRVAGVAAAAAGSVAIVWIARAYVASTGSIRALVVISAAGLLAVWVGRPAFTERSSGPPGVEVSGPRPRTQPAEPINEEAPPTSATN